MHKGHRFTARTCRAASILLFVTACSLPASPLLAQGNIDITYGSTFSGSDGLFFVDAGQVGFDSSNVGVLAVGYFDSTFDVATESSRLVADSLADFIGNFKLLASTNFNGAVSPGYLSATGQFAEQSVGTRPYLLALEGISSYANAANATGIGLFTDTSLPTLPYGADPVATPYDLGITLTFDTVRLGTEIPKSTFGNGNAYATQVLPELPAIWGGASSLGNEWLSLTWFGLFSRDASTPWVYHYHLGWCYPSGTDPDGFWLWRNDWNSWAYTGSTLFPMLWLDSQQKWIWLGLEQDSFTTQVYDSTTGSWSESGL